MKKLLLCLFVPALLTACKTTLFDALPGETQQQFPDTLVGSYYVKIPSSFFKRPNLKDTLFLDVTKASYATRDSLRTETIKLNDSNKLQLVAGKHYVLATENSEYKNYWELAFIEPTKRGVKVMYIIDDEKSTVLPNYFKRNFIAVNNAGDSVFAYKTNDSLLVSYYEKVLRKKEALELIRIKK